MEDIPEDVVAILNEIAGVVDFPEMFSSEWWTKYGDAYTTLQERERKRQAKHWRWSNPHWPQPPVRENS